VERREGYDAFAVRPDGSTWATSGWSDHDGHATHDELA
jgi:hypothetical protein